MKGIVLDKNLDNKVLFSKKTNDFIVLMLGLAFVLIYCTSVLLYYLTAQTMDHFYLKIFVLFMVYLFLYLACIYLVTSRVKDLFYPLDNLYSILSKDSDKAIGDAEDFEDLVRQIQAQIKSKESLERTLDETRESLDDISRIKDEQNVLLAEGIKGCTRKLSELKRTLDIIKKDNANTCLVCDDLEALGSSIGNKKLHIDEAKEEVSASVHTSLMAVSDVKAEVEALDEAFELLIDMLNEAANNLDLIFSDVQALNSATTQTNLFVLTAKLEISRASSFSMGVHNALDDLDAMTKDIIDKADGFSMFIIKTKNSINLALDQATYCKEQIGSKELGFSHAMDALNLTSSQLKEMAEYVGLVNDGVVRIIDGLKQVNAYGHSINTAREKSLMSVNDMKKILAGN